MLWTLIPFITMMLKQRLWYQYRKLDEVEKVDAQTALHQKSTDSEETGYMPDGIHTYNDTNTGDKVYEMAVKELLLPYKGIYIHVSLWLHPDSWYSSSGFLLEIYEDYIGLLNIVPYWYKGTLFYLPFRVDIPIQKICAITHPLIRDGYR